MRGLIVIKRNESTARIFDGLKKLIMSGEISEVNIISVRVPDLGGAEKGGMLLPRLTGKNLIVYDGAVPVRQGIVQSVVLHISTVGGVIKFA
jgi:hypothetical protein